MKSCSFQNLLSKKQNDFNLKNECFKIMFMIKKYLGDKKLKLYKVVKI